MEVGPLARMLVAYVSGRTARVKELVDKVLSSLGVGPEALFSTLGRIAARAIEAQVIVESMNMWVQGLADNMARRDYRIQDNSKWEPASWPKDCMGAGFHEAPRGSLGHWVHINNGSIVNYQCVVPSTWNAGPRDAEGRPGPYEAPWSHSNGQTRSAARNPAHAAPFDPAWLRRPVVDAMKREVTRVRSCECHDRIARRQSSLSGTAGPPDSLAAVLFDPSCYGDRLLHRPSFISVPGAATDHFVIGAVRAVHVCRDRIRAGDARAVYWLFVSNNCARLTDLVRCHWPPAQLEDAEVLFLHQSQSG